MCAHIYRWLRNLEFEGEWKNSPRRFCIGFNFVTLICCIDHSKPAWLESKLCVNGASCIAIRLTMELFCPNFASVTTPLCNNHVQQCVRSAINFIGAVTLVKLSTKPGPVSIANSVEIYEALITQQSLSNHAAFCWSAQQMWPTWKIAKSAWGTLTSIAWIPIKTTGFRLLNFTKQQ